MENEQRAAIYHQVVELKLNLGDGFFSEWITFHFDYGWEANRVFGWICSCARKAQIAIPWYKQFGIQSRMIHSKGFYECDMRFRKVLCKPFRMKEFTIEDLKLEKEKRERICNENK